MRRITTYILSMTVLVLLTGIINAQESTSNDLALGGEQYFLMGAVLETATPTSTQQDGGILGDKSRIRIINLGPIVNWNGLDYTPTVSADGKTLYYVSNRPGSKIGEDDID